MVVLLAGCGTADEEPPGTVAIGETCGGFSEPAARALERLARTGRAVAERARELSSFDDRAHLWSSNGQPVCVIRLVGGDKADSLVRFSFARVPKAPNLDRTGGSAEALVGLEGYSIAGEAKLWFRCGDLGVVLGWMTTRGTSDDDPADRNVVLQDLVHRATVAWGCADEAKVPGPGNA
ncbi:hypothetical protein [Streptomyces sp. NPDC093795]|uniref:hypothetical protein n=1 Tax=Streptomyces sp. NPDC093795 TaxID=3366051 RepID=UPI0037FBCEAF